MDEILDDPQADDVTVQVTRRLEGRQPCAAHPQRFPRQVDAQGTFPCPLTDMPCTCCQECAAECYERRIEAYNDWRDTFEQNG